MKNEKRLFSVIFYYSSTLLIVVALLLAWLFTAKNSISQKFPPESQITCYELMFAFENKYFPQLFLHLKSPDLQNVFLKSQHEIKNFKSEFLIDSVLYMKLLYIGFLDFQDLKRININAPIIEKMNEQPLKIDVSHHHHRFSISLKLSGKSELNYPDLTIPLEWFLKNMNVTELKICLKQNSKDAQITHKIVPWQNFLK